MRKFTGFYIFAQYFSKLHWFVEEVFKTFQDLSRPFKTFQDLSRRRRGQYALQCIRRLIRCATRAKKILVAQEKCSRIGLGGDIVRHCLA